MRMSPVVDSDLLEVSLTLTSILYFAEEEEETIG